MRPRRGPTNGRTLNLPSRRSHAQVRPPGPRSGGSGSLRLEALHAAEREAPTTLRIPVVRQLAGERELMHPLPADTQHASRLRPGQFPFHQRFVKSHTRKVAGYPQVVKGGLPRGLGGCVGGGVDAP